MENEARALAALRHGDGGAIDFFVARYGAYVAAIVNNMLSGLPPADAEEAAADVFVALWRNAARVPEGSVRAYLAGIARNKARDALRRRRLCATLEDDALELAAPSPESELTERELAERTRRAVLAMPEPDREIFLRHYFYEQSAAEIALLLDMNTNTVKSRLRRGRERLRAELIKED